MTARQTALRFATVLAVCAASGSVRAQGDPLRFVNDETQVGTVGFRFTETETLLVPNLELAIATTQPSFPDALKRRFKPLQVALGRPGVYPFLPVVVAKDAVRLERYYAQNGFPRARVDYEARLDSSSNLASVTFVIDEGPPLLAEAVRFAGPGQSDVADQLAPEIRDDWARYTRRPAVREGDRLSDFSLVSLQNGTLQWLRQRGYAFASAGVEQFVDSTGLAADVRVKVNAGPRARYGPVEVVGAEGLPERIITRELPFREGDRFDGGDLPEGQSELFGLGLFQLALVEIVDGQPRDSTVDVRVRLRRGPSRTVSGFLGYFSDGGITPRFQLTHRNLLGGAQQLSLNLEARTGIGGQAGQSVSGGAITDYRGSVSFRQPYVFDRRLSAVVQPSVRQRDDEIEQSRSAELSGQLLYTRSSLRTVSLGVLGRYVDLSRGQGLRLLDPLSQLNTSMLTAAAFGPRLAVTWGRLDNALQPRRGIVARPSLSAAFGDVSYGRGRLAVSALMPVNDRVGLQFRVVGGGVMTRGQTDADTGLDYILLRDQLFYSGGTADVRGWATNRLGPKAIVVTADTSVTGRADVRSNGDVIYVGIGGRAKASASLQLNLPFPLGPQWGSNVFADAGQVFNPSTVPTTLLLRSSGNVADAQLADILGREGGLRVGAGAGLSYLTPIGFISVALGIKLNPSYLDLRSAANVYCGNDGVVLTDTDGDPDTPREGICPGGYIDARKNNTTFDKDDIEPSRGFLGLLPQGGRLQFHFSIGQTF